MKSTLCNLHGSMHYSRMRVKTNSIITGWNWLVNCNWVNSMKTKIQFGNYYGTIKCSQRKWETRRERLKSALYLRLKKRKTFFFWKKTWNFGKFFSFGKCLTVPKNVKRGPFLIYKHAFCCRTTKNSKGGPLGHWKFSKKNRTEPKKIKRGTL